ncbi:MAG: hypothetical protein Ct9H90mP16_14650 [Candidatus Poseidoniales archaeon]|nr:MAG: hypothetical protein Ct9H90mP16_14650 [Candidatus Poseidoniales archaeon]
MLNFRIHQDPGAFVSSESHYSVEIAANTLGMGTDNLLRRKRPQGKMHQFA